MTAFGDWLAETAAATTTVFRDNDPDAQRNRCVEWVRLQTFVLDRLGVKSRPVPVNVLAGNRAAAPQLLHNVPFTPDSEKAGAWTVGVDYRHPAGGRGWDGHLVVAVSNPERHSGIMRYTPMPPQADAARVWRDSTAWNNPAIVEMAEFVAGYCTPWADR